MYASVAESMNDDNNNIPCFFFHTLRDANTKSITDDLLNFNAFFWFVECMHFEYVFDYM
jgi:hypothetical protein